MSLMRVKVRWTIPGAGTSYSVFHFGDDGDSDISSVDANSAATKCATFFTAIRSCFPQAVKWDVMQDVEHINVTTGDLENVVNINPIAQITGQVGTTIAWAAPAGACITWTTNGIRQVASKPRRVRGRTFLVPLSSQVFATDGTINDLDLGTLKTAANNLASSGSGAPLVVYGRPGVGDTPPGQVFVVTGSRITDQVAILRSRRS